MIKTFDMLSQITVYASTTLNSDDVNVITLLYAPLIEADAYKMYMTLHSLLNRTSLQSQTLHQKELLDILGLNPNSFGEARLKLEAIGLLNTYKCNNEYMFLLKSPLTAKGFLSDGVLGMYLYSLLGDTEFKRIQRLFQIKTVDKTGYDEITASFDDVFKSVEEIKIENDEYIVDRRLNSGIKISNYNFDFDLFISGISLSFLEGGRVTKKFEKFIISIAFAYEFSESEMQEVYEKSLNSSGNFDYILCSRRSREKYAETHERKLPMLGIQEEVHKEELEKLYEKMTPRLVIETATGNKYPTAVDIDKIHQLYQEYESLPRSVVNLCANFVIRKCKKVPTFSYFDTVLKDWLKKEITVFDKAYLEVVRRENAISKKRGAKDPDWLKEYVKNFEEGVEDL
jgi:replication initiation and membrane attachment protein